jgi:hypothetical protein
MAPGRGPNGSSEARVKAFFISLRRGFVDVGGRAREVRDAVNALEDLRCILDIDDVHSRRWAYERWKACWISEAFIDSHIDVRVLASAKYPTGFRSQEEGACLRALAEELVVIHRDEVVEEAASAQEARDLDGTPYPAESKRFTVRFLRQKPREENG